MRTREPAWRAEGDVRGPQAYAGATEKMMGVDLDRCPIPLLELRFEAEFETPLRLPRFPGSLLRGVFGAALRERACLTGAPSCGRCPLIIICAYPAVFEPLPRDLSAVGLPRLHEGLPPPFILRLPAEARGASQRLVFGMALAPAAVPLLPLVLAAWQAALERGLGRARVPGRLVSVRNGETGDPIRSQEELPWAAAGERRLARAGPEVELVLQIPLRLVSKGAPIPIERLSPRTMVAAIVRRARMMAVHAGPEVQAQVRDWPVTEWLVMAEDVQHRPDLVWQDAWRRSARQGRWMNFGGLTGRWTWEKVPDPLQALLSLGALLHVGKDASFGLGALAVRSLTRPV